MINETSFVRHVRVANNLFRIEPKGPCKWVIVAIGRYSINGETKGEFVPFRKPEKVATIYRRIKGTRYRVVNEWVGEVGLSNDWTTAVRLSADFAWPSVVIAKAPK